MFYCLCSITLCFAVHFYLQMLCYIWVCVLTFVFICMSSFVHFLDGFCFLVMFVRNGGFAE